MENTPANPETVFVTQPLISIVLEDGEKQIPITELESLIGFKWAPYLEFADLSTHEYIISRTSKMHRKALLSREQLWRGCYFRKEIETGFVPDVQLRWVNSSIGWGVFAKRAFQAMEFIGEYCGVVRKRKRADRKNGYCFEYAITDEISTAYNIDARDQGSITRFINHSSTPNVFTAVATFSQISHIILLTKEAIPKGTQLAYDYGSHYWSCRPAPQPLHIGC